ncbi:hypothetical protein NUH87_31125 [Pseudomonas batumici]|uniref:hypothetical protein n=1 Tax=Pseudomonas batumici TaxID=226910 RepID=UPI0030D401D0
MKDAFQALKPEAPGTLPRQSTIKGLSKEEALKKIENYKKYGIYHLIYTLAPEFPQIEYQYEGKTLHEVSPMGERWTASILPVIEEVDNELRILDPELRYVGKRG